jgi:hypothetical protein
VIVWPSEGADGNGCWLSIVTPFVC